MLILPNLPLLTLINPKINGWWVFFFATCTFFYCLVGRAALCSLLSWFWCSLCNTVNRYLLLQHKTALHLHDLFHLEELKVLCRSKMIWQGDMRLNEGPLFKYVQGCVTYSSSFLEIINAQYRPLRIYTLRMFQALLNGNASNLVILCLI